MEILLGSVAGILVSLDNMRLSEYLTTGVDSGTAEPPGQGEVNVFSKDLIELTNSPSAGSINNLDPGIEF